MADLNQRQAVPPKTDAKPTAQPVGATTEIDLVELMFRLLAHWKFIVCLALIFAVAFGVYAETLLEPVYQATSVLYVVGRNDSAINVSDLQLGTALTPDYLKIFDIWEIHAQVIDNLNLPYSYSQMRGMVSASNTSGTRMIDITVTSTDPELAAAAANEYANVVSQYIADTMVRDRPNIMSVALVPTNPVNGGTSRRVIMGFMLGALLAAGVIVLQALMDDKYKTAEDVRKYTGMATLAIVPLDDSMRDKRVKEKHGR